MHLLKIIGATARSRDVPILNANNYYDVMS